MYKNLNPNRILDLLSSKHIHLVDIMERDDYDRIVKMAIAKKIITPEEADPNAGIMMVAEDNTPVGTYSTEYFSFKLLHDNLKEYADDAIEENRFSGDYNDLENKPCYGDIPTADIIIEKTITDFSYENRDVVEIGALYAGWNNDLETRVFVNIYQDFNEDDMQGLLNNGVFIDSSDGGYEAPFIIDPEGYGNVFLYDNGCYFYTPYSSTITFILVTKDNYIFGDGTPLSRGIWLNYVYYGGMDRIDEFVVPDGEYMTFKYTTKSVNSNSFKQLDEKYVPDSIKDYNNLSNVPCIDSREIKLEKFDLESICNKGIGDSIAEELSAYEQIEIAEGVKIFKISDEPLFTYDDFLYAHLHRIDFDDDYVITGRSINNITFNYELDYLTSNYIDDECYDYNKFLFIQDGLLIVIEDNTSILLKTGNTITLSKGSYGVIENTVVLNNETKAVWCEIEFCHNVGEFKELDEKFIRSYLDDIHDSMVGTYHISNNEKLGESFNSYGESYNYAKGKYSHAEGFNTKTSSFAQHVQGKYNIEDTEDKYAHIVGNGISSSERSNAHTLDWDGNAWFQGQVQGANLPHDTRVFETISSPVVFNGDLTDKTVVDVTPEEANTMSAATNVMLYYVKISDTAPVINGELFNIEMTMFETFEGEVTQTQIPDVNKNDSYIVFNGSIAFVYNESTIMSPFGEECTLTPGIWFYGMQADGYDAYVKNYNMTFLLEGELKKLPSQFVDYMPGKKLEGETFVVSIAQTASDGYPERVDNVEKIAEEGSEIFNDYENNKATGEFSHSEGTETMAVETGAHAEGAGTKALGYAAHAEGNQTSALGNGSHSEGIRSIAIGGASHAEGYETEANGERGHTEGANTKTARGTCYGHAEGYYTEANGQYASHAEGYYTKASSNYQHVQGKFNIEDTEEKYAHIVGNGKNNNSRSNAHTLDWDGNAWYQGNVSVDGTPTNDNDLATKKYVDDVTPHLISETVLLTIPAETINTALETYNNSWNGKLRMDTDLINFPSDRVIYVRFGGYEWTIGRAEANGTISIYSLYTEISSANPDTPAHELLSPGQIQLWTTQGKNAANEVDETKTRISLQFSSPEVTDLVFLTKERVFVPNVSLPEDLEIINTINRGRLPGTTIGSGSIVFGFGSEATAEAGACFGRELKNNGQCTFMAGACNECTNHYSAVFGYGHVNTGRYSFVEGRQNKNTGAYSHVEGYKNEVSGTYSHAEGSWTIVSGSYAHAEGLGSQAKGNLSHAEGQDTIAASANQHVQGKFNIEDGSQTYAHIVGNGTSKEVRSNAHTLDWNGNAWYQGNVSVDGTPTNDKDLTTKKYVDDTVANATPAVITEEDIDNIIADIDN